MAKIRLGIIGAGNMGSGHIKNYLAGKLPEIEIAAVADRRESCRAWAKEVLGENVTIYNEGIDLIKGGKVDAILIAVPHYQHPELAIAGFHNNLHVMCEKPAGVYTKQVKEMNAEADKCDRVFGMMFNQRTNCVYRKIKEMIDGGELGELKRVNWIITSWYRSQSYYDSGDWRATWRGEGGGVLFNQCPHQLDLLQWVTGMMPARVHTFCHFGKWHDIEVEDDVTAYLEYENGATGVFVTSTGDAPGTNRFEILGNKGKLVCEHINKKDILTFYKLEMPEREFNATHTGGFGEPKHEKIEVETDGKNPQHIGILNNFSNAILGLEPLFVQGTEGINGVELMDSMLLSTWLGKTVTLPIDDDLYLNELNKRIATSRQKEAVDTVLDTEGSYGSEKK